MRRNAWSRGLSVTADGTGVVALRLLADKVGLTGALFTALTRRGFVPVHDRGYVLVDVATVPAAGVRRSAISTLCVTNRCGVWWRHRRRCGGCWTR